jgi:RHH-type transcriptional regulator, proline utilization regulon repressor / proline dehydrogenase / delta 1-pyrroline-5-carboxylate dehydrogenase
MSKNELLEDLLAAFARKSLTDRAVHLARWLQTKASELQTPQEKRQQIEFDRMIHNPHDKATLTQLTDQAFRAHVPDRAVDQLIHILDVQGIPRFFNPLDKTLLKGFQSFGSYLPGVAVPLVKANMRKETANVILPAEEDHLAVHLRNRRSHKLRMNVNFLGESLLGEDQALERMETYLAALQQPAIEVISVKVSTIYSQINLLARDHAIHVLADRLERLYRTAANFTYTRHDGTQVPKFIYLDMEEYRDLHITAEAFMAALSRPGLEDISAGIALQAYIPDSLGIQETITTWARKRIQAGGTKIVIRLVKGANMESERAEASIAGWPQAPFKTKLDTDRNYKAMLHQGITRENLAAVHLGIATHNLFEAAYAIVLAAERNILDGLQFEMLEGMANHQRRALHALVDNLLLYAPACKQEHFVNAIGYLVRRLDENSGPDNFLRHSFKLDVDSEAWQTLEAQFQRACVDWETCKGVPRRQQDRRDPPVALPTDAPFTNEPDTDWSIPTNVAWILEQVENAKNQPAAEVPLVVAGEAGFDDLPQAESMDPSRPGTLVARAALADTSAIETALVCAQSDPDGWRAHNANERVEILARVAQNIRLRRGALICTALAECGKIISESDPEISEAIDFLEYYARQARTFTQLPGVTQHPRGVAVVVPPWNFPIAIPVGGIAAALATGNTVILKPSPDALLVAYRLCECFWDAGVSRNVLQFVPTASIPDAQFLVTHETVDVVIFTGGTETAQTILRANPRLEFFAETGGKNAMIVTALADREMAIKHIIHSAFSHSGQKCSATSLLILEDEVYYDESFKELLADAVDSLSVGSAWDVKNKLGPLIRPPARKLDEALKELEAGESWLVMPEQLKENPRLYTPGIKWGVQAGSTAHLIEFFGPVLSVMRAKNLAEAIDLVHQTGYGLTSGLESLDDREQKRWLQRVQAGNLYVNRSTTGAIVHRQPFGGMGKSAFGPGIKAGGPNYVLQFLRFEETADPRGADLTDDPLRNLLDAMETHTGFPAEEIEKIVVAARSYTLQMTEEFGIEHDDFKLIGQDNIRRYLPVHDLRIRVCANDSLFEIFARVCAARLAGCRITVSQDDALDSPAVAFLEQATESWGASIEFVEESDAELIEVIHSGHTGRLRYTRPENIPTSIWETVAETGIHLAHAPVLMEGRIELLWYLREQSLSIDYHRYGNLGERATEARTETL